MAEYLIQGETLTAIADAIRENSNVGTTPMTPYQMAGNISQVYDAGYDTGYEEGYEAGQSEGGGSSGSTENTYVIRNNLSCVVCAGGTLIPAGQSAALPVVSSSGGFLSVLVMSTDTNLKIYINNVSQTAFYNNSSSFAMQSGSTVSLNTFKIWAITKVPSTGDVVDIGDAS